MMKRYAYCFFLLFHVTCFAQVQTSPKFEQKQYTDENGLPQNSVQGLAFDKLGFLWIATQGGLARFDGQNMVISTKADLAVSSDRFIRLKTDMQTGIAYGVNDFRQLVRMSDGVAQRDNRYASDYDMDLDAIRPGRNGPALTMQIDTSRNRDSYMKYRVIYGSPGRYYVYANEKIGFYENGKLTSIKSFPGLAHFEPFPGEPTMRKKVVKETKKDVFVDNLMSINGSLFYHAGSEGDILLKLSTGESLPIELSGDIKQHPKYQTNRKEIRIVCNRFEGQAFAYLGTSIYLISHSPKTNSLSTKLLIEGIDIDANLIYRMLYAESSRTLFLGSLSQGLFVVRANVFRSVGQEAHQAFNSFFYAHVPSSDSTVIIPEGYIVGNSGLAGSGIPFMRTGKPTFTYGMLKTRNGDLWSIKSDSVCKFSPSGALISVWRTGLHPERLYQGLGDDVWVGLINGRILRISAVDQKMKYVTKVKARCTFLYQDTPGKIWVGTNLGLFLYDSSQNLAFAVKSLAGKDIRSIYGDAPGRIWITTYGDGMFLLDQNKLFKMPLDDRKYLAYAHCILEDKNADFWISSNKGLFRIAKSDLIAYSQRTLQHVSYLYYNKEDGFLTNEFNGGCEPCGLRLKKGYITLPSMNGIVWFKPEHIPLPYLGSPFLIENFTLDEKHVGFADTLRLPYDFSHLSMQVNSSFMGLADNLDYLYHVASEDQSGEDWKKVGADRVIHIYQVKPGIHILRIKKITGFGGKHIERRVVLLVDGPWFLSWWFILITLLVLGLIFWVFTKWRLRSLTRQNAELSEKVQQRTEHLERTFQELKVSDDALKTQLQIQMHIIGVINHDVHSPLRSLNTHVAGYVNQVAPYLDDPQMVRLGQSIGKSTQKVYNLVDELLMFIKATYNKKGQILYEPVAIGEILENKVQFFSEMVHENDTVVKLNYDQPMTVFTNRVMVEILIHNLLDNALKHAYAETVTINGLSGTFGKAAVVVKDSGSGMPPEIMAWLNAGSSEADSDMQKQNAPPPNLGLGLIIVKEITTLLEIKVRADSDETGTSVALIFGETTA